MYKHFKIIRRFLPRRISLYRIKAFLAFPKYYFQGVVISAGSLIENDVEIGFGTRINNPSEIGSGTRIGRHCAIAGGLLTISSNHKTDSIVMSANLATWIGGERVWGLRKKKISIGDGCWFGRNVTVLADVTIGEGAVIAAGSIVTRDIPPYVIAGGVPARVIRYRLPENLVTRILSLKIFKLNLETMRMIKKELTLTLDAELLEKIELVVARSRSRAD